MASPELKHFATMTVTLGERFVVKGGPMGTRTIAEVQTVEVTGDRLTASMVGKSAADWLTLSEDRTYGTLDVRLTLKSDDDEIIYVEYSGRIDLASGEAIAAPLFQTGAEQYDWMNRIQAVGVGAKTGDGLVYELYEVASGA